MPTITRNPGYPLPLRLPHPLPDNPRDANLRQPPAATIANPGEYESISLRGGGFDAGPVLPYTPPTQLTWRSDKQFNCLEVDVECIVCPRGWAVPDKIAVCLDPSNIARAFQVPDLTSAVGATALTGPTWYFAADFVLSPPKLYVDPIMGDPTLSASQFGGRVLRWYGTIPFSRVGIAAWAVNDPYIIQNIGPFQQPWFHLRRWYDPSRRVLTTS